MKITSIQSKLYIVTIFIILIISFVAVNHYFHDVLNTADQRFHTITECGQRFSSIIIDEQTALSNLSPFAGSSGEYSTIKTLCMNCHLDSGNNILTALNERETTFKKLFTIWRETKKNHTDLNSTLLEQEKMALTDRLNQNQLQLSETLNRLSLNMKNKHHRISGQIKLLQFATLLFTILLGGGIFFIGKQILDQVKRTVAEVHKIEKDPSYKIEIDNSIPDEFKVGFKALNSMSDSINDHIKKLNTAYTELTQANQDLHTKIMERKQAEETLKDSEQFLQSVFDAIQDGISVLDNNLNIVRVNRAIEQWYPHVQSLVGKRCYKAYHCRTEPCRPCPSLRALKHKTMQMDVVPWDGADGENIGWLELYAFPLFDAAGDIRGVIGYIRDITERLKTEETLRLYEQIISSTSDHMSFLDRDYVYRAVNKAYLKTHQKTRQEIIGLGVPDLLGVDVYERSVKEKLDRCLAGEEIHYQEWFDFPGSGRCFMDVAYYPYVNENGALSGVVVSSRDITKRKQTEEMLRNIEKRFRKILEDVSNIAIQVYDEERRTTFWNKASEKLYGYTQNEALGKKLEDLIIPSSMQKEVKRLIHRWLEYGEKIPAGEAILVDKNGKDVPVFSSHSMNETSEGKELFCIDVDLKSLKQAEKQIKASLKEKEVLLREIHHRVKNNMQVIISLLRMHSRRIDDPRLGEIFNECRDRIYAMSLIHEALYQSEDLAQIDFGVYIKKLCRNLNQAYGASTKGIAITVEVCNVTLGMDQGIAVGMVISELVANAFKHAFPEGNGGSVSIRLSGLSEEEIELIVEDDGIGLPPEIDILKSPSLGLDLAVAAVTRELNGDIKVERNGGTRFVIHFKCKS